MRPARLPQKILGSQDTEEMAERPTKSQPGEAVKERRRAFIRLANDRVNTAIDSIIAIAYLTNPKNYKSIPEDWDKIIAALRQTVDIVEIKARTDLPPVWEPLQE